MGLADIAVAVAIELDLVAVAKSKIFNHIVLATGAVIPPGAEMENVSTLTAGEDVVVAANPT